MNGPSRCQRSLTTIWSPPALLAPRAPMFGHGSRLHLSLRPIFRHRRLRSGARSRFPRHCHHRILLAHLSISIRLLTRKMVACNFIPLSGEVPGTAQTTRAMEFRWEEARRFSMMLGLDFGVDVTCRCRRKGVFPFDSMMDAMDAMGLACLSPGNICLGLQFLSLSSISPIFISVPLPWICCFLVFSVLLPFLCIYVRFLLSSFLSILSMIPRSLLIITENPITNLTCCSHLLMISSMVFPGCLGRVVVAYYALCQYSKLHMYVLFPVLYTHEIEMWWPRFNIQS